MNLIFKNILTVQKFLITRFAFRHPGGFSRNKLTIINKICNYILITPSRNNFRQMKACTRINSS